MEHACSNEGRMYLASSLLGKWWESAHQEGCSAIKRSGCFLESGKYCRNSTMACQTFISIYNVASGAVMTVRVKLMCSYRDLSQNQAGVA